MFSMVVLYTDTSFDVWQHSGIGLVTIVTNMLLNSFTAIGDNINRLLQTV